MGVENSKSYNNVNSRTLCRESETKLEISDCVHIHRRYARNK
jgi:hypothetical protein